MTNLETEILEDFKRRLASQLPLRGMILFGSRARGDADPDSDMDVVVVVEGPIDAAVHHTVSLCAWEASVPKSVVLTPIPVSRTDWEEGPESDSLLAIAVRREGVAI